jgi:hypothetical protein
MQTELKRVQGYDQAFQLTFILGFPVALYEKQTVGREREYKLDELVWFSFEVIL